MYSYQHELTDAEKQHRNKNIIGSAIVLLWIGLVVAAIVWALVAAASGAASAGFGGDGEYTGVCDTQTPTCNG